MSFTSTKTNKAEEEHNYVGVHLRLVNRKTRITATPM